MTISTVTVDCSDAAALARFWARALGWDVAPGASADVAAVGGPRRPADTPSLIFARVPEPKATKNRWHLDLDTDDPEAAAPHLESLGASILRRVSEEGASWIVLADPAGNEFCVALPPSLTDDTGGSTVALTDLDTVAEMALPTLPDWAWAHRVHAQLVGAWLATDIDVVVDEGTSTTEEVRQVLAEVPAGTTVFHVVLTADYDRSLARALTDPGRGLSRDPDFLRADHLSYAQQLPLLPCNLRLDAPHPGRAHKSRRLPRGTRGSARQPSLLRTVRPHWAGANDGHFPSDR